MSNSKNMKGGFIVIYLIVLLLLLLVLLAFVPGIINSIQLKKAEDAIEVLQKSRELVSKNYANRVPMRHICFNGHLGIDYCSDGGELYYSFDAWDVTMTRNPVSRRTITVKLKPTFEQDAILWRCIFMDDRNQGRVYGFDCEEGRRFVN